MKVAINDCFGGFGLSTEAIKWLIAKNSPLIHIKPIEEYTGGNKDPFLPSEQQEDVGDGFVKGFTSTLFKDGMAYIDDTRSDNRDHPDLIEVIETLGEKSWGEYAELKIVEIPDDIEWFIDEYDGVETIHEVHRSWG